MRRLTAKGRNSRPCSASSQSDAGRIEAGPCESVCGQPCAGLNEALSREGAGENGMKPLKLPHALLLSAGLVAVAFHALAGAVSPDLHSGMRGGDDRAVRSSDGGASRLDGIDCMLNPKSCIHKITWYQDRDNSMSPVSTKKGVGAAMASVFTKNGISQAIQVCPGVYLATAHGVLDNPKEARREERPQETPSGNTHGMSPYPLSRETVMTLEKL